MADEVSFGAARKVHTACLSIILVKEVTPRQVSQLVVQVNIACLKGAQSRYLTQFAPLTVPKFATSIPHKIILPRSKYSQNVLFSRNKA